MLDRLTVILFAGYAIAQIKKELEILFHDDIFEPLVLELAIDSWNIKYLSGGDDEEMYLIVRNKIERFIDKEEFEKEEIINLINFCINRLLEDLGEPLFKIIRDDVKYVQLLKICNDDLFIEVIRKNDEEG